MTVFDVASILIAVAALSGYVNHRLLRLPPTSGTLLVALVSSLVVVAIEQIAPGVQLRPAVERFVGQIDFDQTLMHGLLCLLLFAGALHVDLEGLRPRFPQPKGHAGSQKTRYNHLSGRLASIHGPFWPPNEVATAGLLSIK